MVICGVNSVQEKMEKGQNENCRVFSIADDKCVPVAFYFERTRFKLAF